jgi:hypothetical protein
MVDILEELADLTPDQLRQVYEQCAPADRRALEAAAAQVIDPNPEMRGLGWEQWTGKALPSLAAFPFGDHHREMWDWGWQLEPRKRSSAGHFIACWPRGGGKSTTIESITVAAGATRRRQFVLYVSATQALADQHVSDIAARLESSELAALYPSFTDRHVGKYGSSKGWRRNRLHTASGFVVNAMGLDTAARGIKVDDMRPDLIILDDIDLLRDNAPSTQKKINAITDSILPTISPWGCAIFVQNLINDDGIMARLLDRKEHWLLPRIEVGPLPAVRNLSIQMAEDGEAPTVTGDPIWVGQDIATCNAYIGTFGLNAFLRECQHEVSAKPGALWARHYFTHGQPPGEFDRACVTVDPSVTDKDTSDECGIIGGGVSDGVAYIVADRSGVMSHEKWGTESVRLACEIGANKIVVENNQGGDLAVDTVRRAARELSEQARKSKRRSDEQYVRAATIQVVPRTAVKGESKVVRAEIARDYYRVMKPGVGLDPRSHDSYIAARTVVHGEGLGALEKEQTTWEGHGKSPNRVDALGYLLEVLLPKRGPRAKAAGPMFG